MIQALLFSNGFTSAYRSARSFAVHMIGNIMEPRMMGHRLGITTLVVSLRLGITARSGCFVRSFDQRLRPDGNH